MYRVEFYESEKGDSPVIDFLNSLDVKMRAKVVSMLQVLEEKGTELRLPYTESLGDGIFELRIKLGSNLTRCLFFFYIEGRIIVTNGFIKKTQKTPQAEIQMAKKRRADFLRQEKKE